MKTLSTSGMQLTAGQEGFKQSDTPYVPSSSSGVTIGFGFDLSQHTTTQISNILSPVVGAAEAKVLSSAARLTGPHAQTWLNAHPNLNVNEQQAKQLLINTYPSYMQTAARVYNANKAPGSPSFNQLNQKVQDVFTDMAYLGQFSIHNVSPEYSNLTSALIGAASSGPQAVVNAISSHQNDWNGYNSRFEDRMTYLTQP